MQKIYIIILLLILASCSHVTPRQQYNIIQKLPPRDERIKSLMLSGMTTFYSDNVAQPSTGFKAIIAGTDSIRVDIKGPLGISLGKGFLSHDNFQYYNVFNNQFIRARLSKENAKTLADSLIQIPEFIRLIICEPPSDPSLYKFVKFDSAKAGAIFINYKITSSGDTSVVENLYYSFAESSIVRYRRQMLKKEIVLIFSYNDFDDFEGCRFPRKIIAEIISKYVRFNLIIDVDDFKKNYAINKPLSLSLPKDAQYIEHIIDFPINKILSP